MGSAPANPRPDAVSTRDVRLIPDGAIQHALQRTDLEGARISEELYGEDDDDELAALVAGTHPFQRHLSEDALAASKHQAANIPAVRR
jgi:precorrin-6x reductase